MSARELHSTIAALHLFHPGPSHPPTASEWALGIPLEIGEIIDQLDSPLLRGRRR
jgi:hypothetical protein